MTATAALDSGRFTPDSVVDGKSPKGIGGVPLSNFGSADFGPVTLTTALTNSVNTVWARVGERVGKDKMYEYMRRYGFNRKPPIDLPARRAARQRRVTTTAGCSTMPTPSTSAASRSARSGCW